MRKIERSSELLWLLGTVFVALGVATCSKADLGVSMIAAPAFVLNEALEALWSGFSVGVLEYIVQGILLVILCAAVRRFSWKYLLSFAVAMIYGYVLDFFLIIMGGVSFDTLPMRWTMLIVGDAITALGVACFFKTYVPLQVYELFVAEIAARFKISINKVKCGFDMSLLLISAVLALTLFGDAASFEWGTIYSRSFHSIGLGTLVTTVINSPIIALMSRLLDRIFEPTAMFEKAEKILKRN